MARKIIKKKSAELPDVQRSRMMFQIIREIKSYNPNEVSTITKLNGAPVASSTIYKWYKSPKNGGTKYASSRTLERIASAFDLEFTLQKKKK